jgi:para-aminobenzoate synthetase component 1
MSFPLYSEINYKDPMEIFSLLNDKVWAVFLDSANHEALFETTNQYSYIAVDPFMTFWLKNGILRGTDQKIVEPFSLLKAIHLFQIDKIPNLPPFQGGIAGYFAYDLCHYLDGILLPKIDDMNFPDLAVGIYDTVISFDHSLKKAWILSTGFPERDRATKRARAKQRLAQINKLINEPKLLTTKLAIACQKPVITANFTRAEYENMVTTAKEYIRSGDIFEVNLSQRFKTNLPAPLPAFELYKKIRLLNPSPFSAYINLGAVKILSASPERFLCLRDRMVEARPIKGTIRRGETLLEDLQLAADLINSDKDRSENVMIVDLMRNDLSRVCTDESVCVEILCGLESYPTVHHLVSVVSGKLKQSYDALDLLAAAFPGGSITGAPKVRAMQIIAELERTRRGPYCGSIGYISFTGEMDTSIVIRTYAMKGDVLVYQAGGAIVLDSDPRCEYEETLTKAAVLSKALEC